MTRDNVVTNTTHLGLEPPGALDVWRIILGIIWRPDEASIARPEVGDRLSTLTSSIPGHKTGEVEVRVRPEEYLGEGDDGCTEALLTPELLAGTRGKALTVALA